MEKGISVIIPSFEGSAGLASLAARLAEVMPTINQAFEIIMVDDGSKDTTWGTITDLQSRYPWLCGVRHAQNYGQYTATLTGLKHARYEVAITMDDDLQHPPEAIPDLLAALERGADVIYAAPHASATPYRLLVAITKSAIGLVCGAIWLRHIRSFRALRTKMYPWADIPEGTALSPDGLLVPVKPRVAVVHVPYGKALATSRYNFRRSAKLLGQIRRAARQPYPPKNSAALVTQQNEHFNAIADRYHKARQHPNHQLLKTLLWRDFFHHFPTSQPSRILRVLEAMCGFADGYDIFAEHAKHPFTYTGFDMSEEVVRTLKHERPELNIYRQDVTQFTPRQEYDVVILLGGLHHVPQHAPEVVEKLAAALAPGGYFINFEPTHGNPITRHVRESIYARNSLFDEQTERAFAVDELCDMFTRAGLVREYISYPGLLAYVLYYNPDAFPWLNIGRGGMVKAAWALDRLFMHNAVGRTLSFATLSLWRKP